mgnify:CR=1 FL=1
MKNLAVTLFRGQQETHKLVNSGLYPSEKHASSSDCFK